MIERREPTAVRGRDRENPFGIQVEVDHYWKPHYLSPGRMSSFGLQYRLAVESGGRTFLNIGKGNGVLEYLLRGAGLRVVSLDMATDVGPTAVGLLPDLPLAAESVDGAMAFQVLEHMPFDLLQVCLASLARVSRYAVIISVPNCAPLELARRPSVRRRLLNVWRNDGGSHPSPTLDPEHFWEIGYDNLSPGQIVDAATAVGLELDQQFRNEHFLYHHFFLLRKSGS